MGPNASGQIKRRSILLGLLFLCGLWQMVILGLSFGSYWTLKQELEASAADSHFAASLIRPSNADLVAAFDALRAEEVRILEDRKSLQQSYVEKARLLLQEANRIEKLSKKPTDWEYSMSMLYDETRRLAHSGIEGPEILAVLARMGMEPGRQADDWQSIIKQAQISLLFGRARDWEACEMIATGRPYEDRHGMLVCQELMIFGPPDRSIAGRLHRFDLIQSLHSAGIGGVYYRELWEMLHSAKSRELMVELFLRIARASNQDALNRAIAQINASCFADRTLWGEIIASLADRAEQEKQHTRAIVLYKLAAEVDPMGRSAGRSLFNQGYLLRANGFPRQAISALERIFPSSANENDSGTHIMEAYRNYRHRAALEIAAAYKDLHDYPMAFYYSWLASSRYQYRSWCGTCRWSADAEMRRKLVNTSLAAGPLFFATNMVATPLVQWRLWVALGVLIWVVRKLARGRGIVNPSMSA